MKLVFWRVSEARAQHILLQSGQIACLIKTDGGEPNIGRVDGLKGVPRDVFGGKFNQLLFSHVFEKSLQNLG